MAKRHWHKVVELVDELVWHGHPVRKLRIDGRRIEHTRWEDRLRVAVAAGHLEPPRIGVARRPARTVAVGDLLPHLWRRGGPPCGAQELSTLRTGRLARPVGACLTSVGEIRCSLSCRSSRHWYTSVVRRSLSALCRCTALKSTSCTPPLSSLPLTWISVSSRAGSSSFSPSRWCTCRRTARRRVDSLRALPSFHQRRAAERRESPRPAGALAPPAPACSRGRMGRYSTDERRTMSCAWWRGRKRRSGSATREGGCIGGA
eukprot:scaffold69855_cov27-Tisochrysis_lutea.AAC.1